MRLIAFGDVINLCPKFVLTFKRSLSTSATEKHDELVNGKLPLYHLQMKSINSWNVGARQGARVRMKKKHWCLEQIHLTSHPPFGTWVPDITL